MKKLLKGEVRVIFLSALGIHLGEVILPKKDAKTLLKIEPKLKHVTLYQQK
jgi:hypothetical protein